MTVPDPAHHIDFDVADQVYDLLARTDLVGAAITDPPDEHGGPARPKAVLEVPGPWT